MAEEPTTFMKWMAKGLGITTEELRAFYGWVAYSVPLWKDAGMTDEQIAETIKDGWKREHDDILRRYRAGDFAGVGYPYVAPTVTPEEVGLSEATIRFMARAMGLTEEETRAYIGWLTYSAPRWKKAGYTDEQIKEAASRESWEANKSDIMRRYRAGDFATVGYPYVKPSVIVTPTPTVTPGPAVIESYELKVQQARDRFKELVAKDVKDIGEYLGLYNYCQNLLTRVQQLPIAMTMIYPPTPPPEWQVALIQRLQTLMAKITAKMEELRQYVATGPELPSPIVGYIPLASPKNAGLTAEQAKINEQLDHYEAEAVKLANMLSHAKEAEPYNNVYMDIYDNANKLLAQLDAYLTIMIRGPLTTTLTLALLRGPATPQQIQRGMTIRAQIIKIRDLAYANAKAINPLPSLEEAQNQAAIQWATSIISESKQTSTPLYRDVEAQYGVLNTTPIRPPSKEQLETIPFGWSVEIPQLIAYTEPLAPGEEASVSDRMKAVTGQEPWTLAGAEVPPEEKKISPWLIGLGLLVVTGGIYAYKKKKRS